MSPAAADMIATWPVPSVPVVVAPRPFPGSLDVSTRSGWAGASWSYGLETTTGLDRSDTLGQPPGYTIPPALPGDGGSEWLSGSGFVYANPGTAVRITYTTDFRLTGTDPLAAGLQGSWSLFSRFPAVTARLTLNGVLLDTWAADGL